MYVNENFHKLFMKRSISEIGNTRTLPYQVQSADNSPMRPRNYNSNTYSLNSRIPSRIRKYKNSNNNSPNRVHHHSGRDAYVQQPNQYNYNHNNNSHHQKHMDFNHRETIKHPSLNRSTSHTEFYRIRKTNTLFHNNSSDHVDVYSSPVYDTLPLQPHYDTPPYL